MTGTKLEIYESIENFARPEVEDEGRPIPSHYPHLSFRTKFLKHPVCTCVSYIYIFLDASANSATRNIVPSIYLLFPRDRPIDNVVHSRRNFRKLADRRPLNQRCLTILSIRWQSFPVTNLLSRKINLSNQSVLAKLIYRINHLNKIILAKLIHQN